MAKQIFVYGRQIVIIAIAVVFALAFTGCDMETKIEPDHDHQWGDWTQHRAAACTEAGVLIRTCALDSAHVEYDTGEDALGHDWSDEDEIVKIPATETKNGIKARFCIIDPEHIIETDEFSGEYATGTVGLSYTLIDNDTAYRVHNGGDKTFTAVHIPAYHRPDANSPYLPVTQVGNSTNGYGDNAFGGTMGGTMGTTRINNTALIAVTFAEDSQLTSISNYAFYNCTNLTDITFPNSLKVISGSVFNGCTNLVSVTFPDDVEFSSGGGQFTNCENLKSITIPANTTVIGPSMFYNCYALTSIIIPEGVTSIEGSAFNGCRNLASVTLPKSLISIKSLGNANQGAFGYCASLTSITLPEGLTSIGTYAFSSTGLTSVIIPASVTSIGNNAFSPAGFTSITFKGNGITTFSSTVAIVQNFSSFRTVYNSSENPTKAGTYTLNRETGTWAKTSEL